MTTETIFFTLRYMCEEVIVPSGGFEYKNDFCPQQRITFPEGAVEGNMKITINTMSIEGECKRKRLKEEMGSDTSISSLSDIVYVHHSQPFKKKVKLRLKLDPLFSDNQSSETFLFHCDDNGCLRVLEDVKMRKVPEEEVGGDNHIYEVEVDTFSGIGGFHGDRRKDYTRTLPKIYGLGRDQCRILVFLYKEDNDLHLWSDIVPEKKWKRRERELQKRDGLIFLRNTVSPSVPVKNFGRLRITVLHNGRMLTAPEVPSNSTFMYYDRHAREIYNHFPVVPNKGITNETGIIQYEIDTAPRRLLHTAYINVDLYLVGLQASVRQIRQQTQRPRTQQQPDRPISRQPGVRRTPQADDAKE
ncbi:uncharacterized protein LOC110455490 [Mizuhopecten yessoensis]|uniref:uncharacterized protein LOC110455490 n=1 Tax=Mizuhopecten yessoensis TaxID=6573 RepID=UPI000B45E2F1|nr:uncharacterized protein LOC110455490 [Mizuhopecten yessoensis]